MLYWALVFLIIAVIAGAFGFRGVESTATQIAKVLFFLFLVIFVVLLLFNILGGGGPAVVTTPVVTP